MIEHKLNRMYIYIIIYIYISRCERLLTKWCNFPPDLVLLKVCISQMICCSDLPVISPDTPGFSTKVLPGDRRLAAYGRAATQLQVQPGRGQGARA